MRSGMELIPGGGMKLVLDSKPKNKTREYVLCALIEEPASQFGIYDRKLDNPDNLDNGRRYNNLVAAVKAFTAIMEGIH